MTVPSITQGDGFVLLHSLTTIFFQQSNPINDSSNSLPDLPAWPATKRFVDEREYEDENERNIRCMKRITKSKGNESRENL